MRVLLFVRQLIVFFRWIAAAGTSISGDRGNGQQRNNSARQSELVQRVSALETGLDAAAPKIFR
jgi:hypothetical protein